VRRRNVRLTPEQRNRALRHMALDQYTRALLNYHTARSEVFVPEHKRLIARIVLSRGVLMQALGICSGLTDNPPQGTMRT
jgi:hypothetical protein